MSQSQISEPIPIKSDPKTILKNFLRIFPHLPQISNLKKTTALKSVTEVIFRQTLFQLYPHKQNDKIRYIVPSSWGDSGHFFVLFLNWFP
jgi:hypothetical protein